MKKRVASIVLVLAMGVWLAACSAGLSADQTVPYGDTSGTQAEYPSEIFGKDVITVNITADDEDWSYLMENAASKPYISADVTIDGVTFNDVGIKTKGNSSLTQVAGSDSERYSLKLNFNKYVDDQDCYGLDSLVLNNLYSDPSYLKEYLSYELMDYMGVPSSLCTFADIYVNDVHYGFYIAIEDVDDSFLDRNFGEGYAGEAYKPESLDMEVDAGAGAGDWNNAGGGNIGNMSSDITNIFLLTDSSGNAVEWSSVLPDNFNAEAVATVTYADGSTADFDFRNFISADLSEITSLTDENGVTADISAYTLSTAMNNPGMNGGMQGPGEQDIGDLPQNGDTNGLPQVPENETGADAAPGIGNGRGMQGFGNGANGMDGGSLGVNLVYTNDEISSYANIFANAITDPDEEDEQRLIATLKAISEGETLENYIDVDEVLRYAAVNVFLVNLDSYFSNMGHNYCLYEEDGVLTMIPWDYNLAFGTFNSENASDAVNYAIDTVFSGVDAEERPVIGLLLENPAYLEQYHGYLSQLAGYITSGQFAEKVDAVSAVIDSYVQNDSTSFDGYDAFNTGVVALKTFALLRAESVSGQLDGSIPSTEAVQSGSDALIDTTDFDLTALSGMGRGGGFGGANAPFDAERNATPSEASTSPPEEETP